MKTMPLITGLAFLGLFVACEPDPSGPEMEAPELASVSAHPAPPMGLLASNMGAVVHKDEIGCRIPDGNGNPFPEDGWSLPCTREVATNSNSGAAMIVIHAEGVPNSTGRTVHWGPFNAPQYWMDSYSGLTEGPYPCFLLGTDYDLDNPLYTINWKAWVTPSGKATLMCHYQKKWDWQWPSG
jgi:hypothetical protein